MKPRSSHEALYHEESLIRMAEFQRKHAWDLEDSIPWQTTIDPNQPLVPLDEDAIFFPGAGAEERLAISQMMGLIIAASIYEMEECLIRLRKECWEDVQRDMPVAPEFTELGDLFFAEERKHSAAFRRYIEKFADSQGIDLEDLLGVLPVIEGTRSEAILRRNVRNGGQSFWWLVAQVEQEFLLLYRSFKPFKQQLEPLYYTLHEKHFEEEARHASFPYMVLDLLCHRNARLFNFMHVKLDFMTSQVVQGLWTVQSLHKLRGVKKLAHRHPLFAALSHALPLFDSMPRTRALWKVVVSAPYVSSLVNPTSHNKIMRFAKEKGSLVLPFPQPENTKLVGY